MRTTAVKKERKKDVMRRTRRTRNEPKTSTSPPVLPRSEETIRRTKEPRRSAKRGLDPPAATRPKVRALSKLPCLVFRYQYH